MMTEIVVTATIQMECCVCTLDIVKGTAVTLLERGWAHCSCVAGFV